MDEYVIRYDYPGTYKEDPIGLVYVKGPYIGGGYSYTKRVEDAGRFLKSMTDMLLKQAGDWWPDATVIKASDATDLD
jgi:hypothetical protein